MSKNELVGRSMLDEDDMLLIAQALEAFSRSATGSEYERAVKWAQHFHKVYAVMVSSRKLDEWNY